MECLEQIGKTSQMFWETCQAIEFNQDKPGCLIDEHLATRRVPGERVEERLQIETAGRSCGRQGRGRCRGVRQPSISSHLGSGQAPANVLRSSKTPGAQQLTPNVKKANTEDKQKQQNGARQQDRSVEREEAFGFDDNTHAAAASSGGRVVGHLCFLLLFFGLIIL